MKKKNMLKTTSSSILHRQKKPCPKGSPKTFSTFFQVTLSSNNFFYGVKLVQWLVKPVVALLFMNFVPI